MTDGDAFLASRWCVTGEFGLICIRLKCIRIHYVFVEYGAEIFYGIFVKNISLTITLQSKEVSRDG